MSESQVGIILKKFEECSNIIIMSESCVGVEDVGDRMQMRVPQDSSRLEIMAVFLFLLMRCTASHLKICRTAAATSPRLPWFQLAPQ